MIGVTVLGDREIQRKLAMAPVAMSDALEHWMWAERKSFVGNKQVAGSFRRQLENKQRSTRSGPWSGGVTKAFAGRLERGGMNPLDKKLVLGVSDGKLKKMPFLETLTKSHTVVPTSKRWLLIPFYKNLTTAGRYGSWNFGVTKKHWGHFRDERRDSLRFVIYHGKLLVFDGREPPVQGTGKRNRKLLFVGVKQARIKKKFDFIRSAERRGVGMDKRAHKFIDRAVRNIEKGLIRG